MLEQEMLWLSLGIDILSYAVHALHATSGLIICFSVLMMRSELDGMGWDGMISRKERKRKGT